MVVDGLRWIRYAQCVYKQVFLYTDHETFAAMDLLCVFIDFDVDMQPSFLRRSNDFYMNTMFEGKESRSHEKKKGKAFWLLASSPTSVYENKPSLHGKI